MHRYNWDDLRFVLAVAEAGSVSAAARVLGVNHATVLRRVSAFEARSGAELFDRTAAGYAISGHRIRVVEALREVATAVDAVGQLMRGREAPLTGIIRITSTDTLCQWILPGILARLQSQAEGLRIELTSTNTHLDLGRLHADISVRPALRLPDDLAGTPAGLLAFGAYARPGVQGPWLGLSGAIARSAAAEWLARNVEASKVRGGADSFPVLRELAASGTGIAILPAFLGAEDPRLSPVRVAPPIPAVPLWVASHVDLADVPRLRNMRQRLTEALLAEAPRLQGHSAKGG